MRRPHVVIVTNIPNPYRLPLFNELHRQLSEKGMTMKVLFGAQGYERRKFLLKSTDFRFDYQFLGAEKIRFGSDEKTMFTYKGLLGTLKKESPDAIIVSGFSPGTMQAWWYTRFHRSKYIIWSGSISRQGRNDSWLRLLQRKFLLGGATAAVSYGTLAKKYLEKLGMEGGKIFTGINTVDTKFFSEATESIRRNRENADDRKHLLCVGYFSARKNLPALLQVIALVAKSRRDFVLDIVGDGEGRSRLEAFVRKNDLGDVVVFHGFHQKNELPEFYAKSMCLLFQTGFDIWGLVLNEAMAAGLPSICSPNAGASADLVIEGETGFVVNFDETEKAAGTINRMLDHPEEALQMGRNAKALIQTKAGIRQSAEGFVSAIEFTLNRGSK